MIIRLDELFRIEVNSETYALQRRIRGRSSNRWKVVGYYRDLCGVLQRVQAERISVQGECSLGDLLAAVQALAQETKGIAEQLEQTLKIRGDQSV